MSRRYSRVACRHDPLAGRRITTSLPRPLPQRLVLAPRRPVHPPAEEVHRTTRSHPPLDECPGA
jgi:hypothetical protein